MSKTAFGAKSLIFLLVPLLGCSDVTAPRLVTSFDWGEVEDPETVVEGISTSVGFGELFILGQFNTPTRCYKLDANFKRKGSDLTLRVTASTSNSPNCDQSLGGFRYTAIMSNLDFGPYDLTVIHDVAGGTTAEHRTQVVIR